MHVKAVVDINQTTHKADKMSDQRFFGYGSLVNASTHDYPALASATVTGWRRAWRHTAARDLAYLTAVPARGSVLKGITAAVPQGDWAALDLREQAYVRRDASAVVTPAHPDTAIYAIEQDTHSAPSAKHPILRSYLDVVVQGYWQVFGAEGVQHFFETTDGWDTPIFDDRANPVYPRHQVLSAFETALVDRGLATAIEQSQQL
jgi:hypothetical protein